MTEKIYVLEESTNTHRVKDGVQLQLLAKSSIMTTKVLKTNGEMIVEHGHHNTVATLPHTKCVIKITQQEMNPITKAFENAYD